MPFSLRIRGPVLYTSWRGFTPDDLDEVVARVSKLRGERGAPVVYVARLPAGGRVFTETEHLVLTRFLTALAPLCATIHHIVEGDGFVKSARWASVTNMAHATSKPSAFHTHATVGEAAAAIRPACGVDLEDLVRSDPVDRSVPPPAPTASRAFEQATRIVHTPPRRLPKP